MKQQFGTFWISKKTKNLKFKQKKNCSTFKNTVEKKEMWRLVRLVNQLDEFFKQKTKKIHKFFNV